MGRLLICAVRSEALYSTIDLFEPMFDDRGKKFRSSSSSRSLVKYKANILHAQGDIIGSFHAKKLCFTSRNGFEVLNLNDKEPVSLLDLKDEAFDFVVQQNDARSIAIFHFGGKGFLLCYNKFAFYVDERGKRSWPDWLVTWEGEPSAFAVDYPYILAFDSKFIEIRHVITGELEQVIPTGPLRSLSTHPDSIQYATTGNDGYHHIYKLKRSAQAIKAAIGV
ncbi:citron-like protein [Syncephalis plumigaleata]|nr:citron-like protein [Syncephalis plumigaleata]